MQSSLRAAAPYPDIERAATRSTRRVGSKPRAIVDDTMQTSLSATLRLWVTLRLETKQSPNRSP
ncbi:protein of unassigned function [Methylobacterium oryzae CBMB20]|uniref:Protein of unassigned function n=1 Tax=Methylobacterium oryzae CBMB20 TaxID=693986 RepID=A0A089NYR9_9HYPH|nr:protein of unassigned function [Methylobacterium oryzae CBMB20]